MGTNAYEGLEVHPFAPEPRASAVAAAEGALGHDHRIGGVEPVRVDEVRSNLRKRPAVQHPLDGAVPRGKLAPAAQAEEPGAVFEQQRAPLLVVDAARRTRAEQR